ncbi:DUF2809 domain-containing protein [Luteolibacter arcticus]|uniref:DUF2809 domain-containing protein n=1 Tax=Luteolibacter arcticus TaxID=1581411 RepID=A0ABT3GQP6_9BACT|nr:DUF2809 domain-containing protein [Luteolibacter arcticus]MCW1925796.1 DUF2809 domain-containing protein [Luteolibacter arcticus]
MKVFRMRRSRLVYAGWIAVTIAAGLVSRSSRAASFLPDFIRSYAGDTLWALMVFLILGFLFPRAKTGVIGLAALGISFGVEISQLYEAEWINRIRATRVGGLVLGRGWVTTDLLCYAVGVGLGVMGEIWKKCRVSSDR